MRYSNGEWICIIRSAYVAEKLVREFLTESEKEYLFQRKLGNELVEIHYYVEEGTVLYSL